MTEFKKYKHKESGEIVFIVQKAFKDNGFVRNEKYVLLQDYDCTKEAFDMREIDFDKQYEPIN